MLTIMPIEISPTKVVLEKKDFDTLLFNAQQVEEIVIQQGEEEFSLLETQDSLREIWENSHDEKTWKRYL